MAASHQRTRELGYTIALALPLGAGETATVLTRTPADRARPDSPPSSAPRRRPGATRRLESCQPLEFFPTVPSFESLNRFP